MRIDSRCAVLLALAAAGCTHTLPAVATPGPTDVPSSTSPVPPGRGRIYVDVVNGPAQVDVVKSVEVTEQVNDLSLDTEELEVQSVCMSPCVLDLPLGPQVLTFPMRGSGGTEVVHVLASPRPTIYRRALGWRKSGGAGFVLGVLGATFGGASFATGAALLPVGLANHRNDLTLAGGITLGAGAIVMAVSIWAIMHDPVMEQPGAGAQYGLPGGDGSR